MALAVEYDENGNEVQKQVNPAQVQQAAQNGGIAGPSQDSSPRVPWSPKIRDTFVQGWRDSGMAATPEALRQYVAQSGGGHFQIINDKGQEKVRDSQGRVYDLIKGVGSAGATKRTGYTTQGTAGNTGSLKGGSKGKAVSGGGSATGGFAGGAGGAGGAAGGFNTGGLGTQAQGLFNLLMKRANMSEVIDPNDPVIKAQTDAYRSEGVNARRDFLAQQAEQAGPYGNLRSEERRSAEQLGKSVGGFQGQVMQQELNRKTAQIEAALSGAQGFLTDQQRMALQNELTRLQLAQQESQFGRNLKQQGSQFDRSLSMQKDQFGRSLGQRAYEFDTGRFDDLFA